jgi:hypothetical protein
MLTSFADMAQAIAFSGYDPKGEAIALFSLISAQENPPEPNQALKATFKEYMEEYGE